jgi:hypothetical protein
MSGVALNDAEWRFISNASPLIINSRDECRKTDEADTFYNCLAWALGFTDRWINPPQPQAVFEDFCKKDI